MSISTWSMTSIEPTAMESQTVIKFYHMRFDAMPNPTINWTTKCYCKKHLRTGHSNRDCTHQILDNLLDFKTCTTLASVGDEGSK